MRSSGAGSNTCLWRWAGSYLLARCVTGNVYTTCVSSRVFFCSSELQVHILLCVKLQFVWLHTVGSGGWERVVFVGRVQVSPYLFSEGAVAANHHSPSIPAPFISSCFCSLSFVANMNGACRYTCIIVYLEFLMCVWQKKQKSIYYQRKFTFHFREVSRFQLQKICSYFLLWEFQFVWQL